MIKKKKTLGYLAFVLCLFAAVTGVMASSGKIDLSGVPVVNKAVAVLSDNIISPEAQNNAVPEETTTLDNHMVLPEGEDNSEYGSEIYSMAALAVPASSYTSISDVSVDGSGNIYAADATGQKAYKLTSSGAISKVYNTDVQVNGVCVGTNNVYVLEGELAGKVVVLDMNMSKVATIEVGHTPNDMVINGTTAYVANRFSNTISVINLSTNKVTKTLTMEGREPFALTIANGKIYAACHSPEESTTEESQIMSSNIVVINTSTNSVSKEFNLINGADGVKGICAAPDGKTVYVSHVIARYTYPTTQLDRGWINTNAISIINTSNDTVTANAMLDEVELGAANPWGITVSNDGTKLICALSGIDEAMIIDIAAMNNKINAVKNGNGVVNTIDDIPNYLPFLDGCRQRVQLSGKGARSVWAASGKVYIGLYFAGSIDVLNLSNNNVSNMNFISQPTNDDVRNGEILFADATKCYQKWQSCLSCHPDARVDSLNWDNMNDGLGNPKSAKSMLYSHRTPPVMSTGIRNSAEIAVRAGMKFIQFNALEEKQMAYIDEYLKSLMPVASPYLNRDGTLTESAKRGKELFVTVGCANCHPAPLYTDLKTHNSKAVDDTTSWENRNMDTSTLVEVWRTAPWVFDGRFNSMEDTVRFYTNGKNLTDQQITDISNYVLSIGGEGEQYGVEQVIVTANDTANVNVLKAGGNISYFTVRRQDGDAVKDAHITVTLESDGNVLKTMTKDITNTDYNKAVKVDLGIDIPSDITPGAKLTITIEDANGNKLASDYALVY